MTNEEIRELIALVTETGVAELEVQRGENRVRIRRAFGMESSIVVPEVIAPAAKIAPPALAAPTARPEPAPAKEPEFELHYVPSPIVGTFYESGSPGSPPFVRIGEHVTPGKVLCIIESMKLMNEIEADATGVVESKLVQNGQPVEYGEKLFGIRVL